MAKRRDKTAERIQQLYRIVRNNNRSQWEYINQKGVDFSNDNQLTETEQQLKFQISAAKSDYQFAIEEYQNKRQNLNLAERIEQKNQTKFFEGIASSFDLRQAQTQLYTAQQEYLQSMFNVITKKSELETILNTVNY